MAEQQITLEEVLELVSFRQDDNDSWVVNSVKGNVSGDVYGNVLGDVEGNVYGHVWGGVKGNVHGTINGRTWQIIEMPEERFRRLLGETENQELIDAFNLFQQKENNNG